MTALCIHHLIHLWAQLRNLSVHVSVKWEQYWLHRVITRVRVNMCKLLSEDRPLINGSYSYDLFLWYYWIVLSAASPETVVLPVRELFSLLKMNRIILLESQVKSKTNNCLLTSETTSSDSHNAVTLKFSKRSPTRSTASQRDRKKDKYFFITLVSAWNWAWN